MSLEDSKFARFVDEDARLVILRALADQKAGALVETLLIVRLSARSHNRSRGWLRTQLNMLAELGAVTLTEDNGEYVAAITFAGLDHVNRVSFLDGVRRPSPANG